MNLKEKLHAVVYGSTTNKHKFNISKHSDLLEWVESVNHVPDMSFLEKVYCLLNDAVPVCDKGKRKNFSNNLNIGYYNCNRATACDCAKEQLSRNISKGKKNLTKEQIIKSNNKRIETCKRLYGVEYNSQSKQIKDKKQATFLEKYGQPTSLLDKNVQDKIKNTLLDKYGVDHPSKSNEIVQKRNATNLKKYGNICSVQNPQIREQIYQKSYELYGVKMLHRNRYTQKQQELLSDKNLLIEKFEDLGLVGICNEYDISPRVIKYRLDQWGIDHATKTSIEEFVEKILENLQISFDYRNRKLISPYELDFVIPDFSIAIEVGGLYWHSEKFVDKHYHLMKQKLCEQKGYRLITIFSDEILNTPQIIEKRLSHVFGKNNRKVHARKCSIKQITTNQEKIFLDNNHIQGSAKSSVKYGAFDQDNELVAVMTFSKNRRFTGDRKSNYYELVRFASVVRSNGLASRLFKRFLKDYAPQKVISYADKRWSNGSLYFKLGFELERESGPNYWYTKDFLTREHRYKYTKHSLVNKGYDSNKTEYQIMNENGYSKIWDCGTMRFSYDKSDQ